MSFQRNWKIEHMGAQYVHVARVNERTSAPLRLVSSLRVNGRRLGNVDVVSRFREIAKCAAGHRFDANRER